MSLLGTAVVDSGAILASGTVLVCKLALKRPLKFESC